MKELTQDQLTAIQLLSDATRNRCDMSDLAGDSYAHYRQRLLSLMTGEKAKRARTSVTKLRELFYTVLPAYRAESCAADRQNMFANDCECILLAAYNSGKLVPTYFEGGEV